MRYKLAGILSFSIAFCAQADTLSKSALERCINLKEEIKESNEYLERLDASIDEKEREFEEIYSSLNWAETNVNSAIATCENYDQACGRANLLIDEYNAMVRKKNQIASRHEYYIERQHREVNIVNEANDQFNQACTGQSFYQKDLNALCSDVFDWNWVFCKANK
ncbi:hypothetical protein [Endozoicomonas elysicola]|uniref:Lysozyme inhibitor LprI N-terminal domain-containing protein n=1 Tax=Endozoicomonas elysicola TaxID=305900 RepID=A0A081KAU1_9GAMM|nr:hypothetical protein [Endozoicomonas elysicola]KEI71267.1 hypothetical protein GV64_11395 [Endozoicomonas elysicola]